MWEQYLKGLQLLLTIYLQCRTQVIPGIGQTRIRAWWKEYENTGELPCVMKNLYRTALIDKEVLVLEGIVDKYPQFYLDEFAFELGKLTGKYLSTTTTYDYLRTDLNANSINI